MILTDIRLENIKNISFFEAEFSTGINLISGAPSSGKSTIFEAIGFVLFDYLAVKKELFVKKGESEGLVRLGFVSKRDGRSYALVRSTGSLYYLFNREQRYKVFETKKDVLCWVLGELALPGHDSLPYIFRYVLLFKSFGGFFELLSNPAKTSKTVSKLLGLSRYDSFGAKTSIYVDKLTEKINALSENEEREKNKLLLSVNQPDSTGCIDKQQKAWELRRSVARRARRIDVISSSISEQIKRLEDDISSAESEREKWGKKREQVLGMLSKLEYSQQLLLKNKKSYDAFVAFQKKGLEIPEMLADREQMRQKYFVLKRSFTRLLEEEEVFVDLELLYKKAGELSSLFSSQSELYKEEISQAINGAPLSFVAMLEKKWVTYKDLLKTAESLKNDIEKIDTSLLSLLGGKGESVELTSFLLKKCAMRREVIAEQERLLLELNNSASESLDCVESEVLIQLSNIESVLSTSISVQSSISKAYRHISLREDRVVDLGKKVSLADLIEPDKIQAMLSHQQYIQNKLAGVKGNFAKNMELDVLSVLRAKLDREISETDSRLAALAAEKEKSKTKLEAKKTQLRSKLDKTTALIEQAKKHLFAKLDKPDSERAFRWFKAMQKLQTLASIRSLGDISTIDGFDIIKSIDSRKKQLRASLDALVSDGKKLSNTIDEIEATKKNIAAIRSEYEEYIEAQRDVVRLSKLAIGCKSLEKLLRTNSLKLTNLKDKKLTLKKRLEILCQAKKNNKHRLTNGVPVNVTHAISAIWESKKDYTELSLFFRGLTPFFSSFAGTLEKEAKFELSQKMDTFFKRFYDTSLSPFRADLSSLAIGLTDAFTPVLNTGTFEIPFELFSHEEKCLAYLCFQLAIFDMIGLNAPLFMDETVLGGSSERVKGTVDFLKDKFVNAQIFLSDSKSQYLEISKNIIRT